MGIESILSFVRERNAEMEEALRLQHKFPTWTVDDNRWFAFSHDLITEKRGDKIFLVTSCVTVRTKKTMKLIKRDYKKISRDDLQDMLALDAAVIHQQVKLKIQNSKLKIN